jgi:hypothetical protein
MRGRAADALGMPPAPGAFGRAEGADLVLLVHADNMAEAERYRSELMGHGIPAVVESERVGGFGAIDGMGVPVLVPETLADEAAERIAELESTRPEEGPVEDEDIFEEEEDLDDIDEEDVDLDDDLDDKVDDDLDDDLDEDLDDDWEDEEDDEEDDDWDDDWDEDEDEDEDDDDLDEDDGF